MKCLFTLIVYVILSHGALFAQAAITDFSPSTQQVRTVPLVINVSDNSANTPTGWLLYFGDGAISTAQNPSHTYKQTGYPYGNYVGDYAVVGARLDADNGTDAGSAYVYKRAGTSWAQETKLLASDCVFSVVIVTNDNLLREKETE